MSVAVESQAVRSSGPAPTGPWLPEPCSDPSVLADIYADTTNIAIWQRQLSGDLRVATAEFLEANKGFEAAIAVSRADACATVSAAMRSGGANALSEDIAVLVEMFCTLFGLERAGLRLATLDHAMCPKFHVDYVPCRLITTYQGVATEWLPHGLVDRTKLGPGSNGLSDQDSGLFRRPQDVQQLAEGHVALLKGEAWQGNTDAGLVHRSPSVPAGGARLVLTLDFIR